MSESDGGTKRITRAQWTVAALVIAFFAGTVLYKILMHEQLGHSAALFLGVPAVIAILIALSARARTATGGIVIGITLALLFVAPLVGEGYLCILMAAPLFYAVGIALGVVIDVVRKERKKTLSCVALVLLPMCLEGVTPGWSFHREETVVASRVVNASAESVEKVLARSPSITDPLPLALRIGFPRPLRAWGDGLAVGSPRAIHFAGAEGDPPGDLVLRVAERRDGYVRFDVVSDESKLTQWIRWTRSEVEWRQVDDAHTLVIWRIHFERQLDPAWYFAPLERAAVGQAARYLINANAVPDGGR